MAFVPTPQGVRVAARFVLYGEQAVNVHHVIADNPGDGFVLAQIATIFRNWYVTNVLPNLAGQLTLLDVTATDISVEGGQQSVQSLNPPAAGGQTGDSLPASVAFVITHRTARVGRSYRGRTYLPGIAEGLTTGNRLQDAVAANLAGAWPVLDTALLDNSFQRAVLSRFNGGAPRAQGVLTPIIASVARDTRLDSQRRRLPRS